MKFLISKKFQQPVTKKPLFSLPIYDAWWWRGRIFEAFLSFDRWENSQTQSEDLGLADKFKPVP